MSLLISILQKLASAVTPAGLLNVNLTSEINVNLLYLSPLLGLQHRSPLQIRNWWQPEETLPQSGCNEGAEVLTR